MEEKNMTIIHILEELYPEADCELQFNSIFQLLISVVLSAQTTDKRVNIVTTELFAIYPDLEAFLTLTEDDLQEYIRSIGMFRTKAKNIMLLCKKLINDFNGIVPDNYEDLISLPGVGRKTANVVLSNAFSQQRIAVDTHVFRVSNRIGIVKEKDVLKTEIALMKAIPEELWSKTHHLLIWHGRRICHAKKPECDICKLNQLCSYYVTR
ncbi:MAG: endonuclease III [Eubacteriales bacterium]